MIKKLLALAAATLLSLSAHATSGCAFTVYGNPQVTAKYGIFITVYGPSKYIVIGPGSMLAASLDDGDQVLVSAENYTCGSLFQLNWGFTTWTHCSTSDAPVPIVMGGDFTSDLYVARAQCMCPAAGYATLTDLYRGSQCSPQPQQ